MKKLHYGLFSLSLLLLLGAGCYSSAPNTKSDTNALTQTNDAIVTFENTVTVQCPTDGAWTCEDKYGGSISLMKDGTGMLEVMIMGDTEVSSVYENLVSQYKAQGNELNDEYFLGEGKTAVLSGNPAGRTHLVFVSEVEGIDMAIQCHANLDTTAFATQKTNLEEMCKSIKAKL